MAYTQLSLAHASGPYWRLSFCSGCSTFRWGRPVRGESTALRRLTLADANGETSRLGLTGGHPMFVVGAGRVHADEVVEGDNIRNADLRELTVLSVEADTRPQIVHNLESADAHTYFAGELEAWGHNNRKPGARRNGCRGSRYVPVSLKRWLINSSRTPKFIKGWYQQQLNRGVPLSKTKNPPGYDWGHAPDNPFCEGGRHGGGSGLETATDNRGRGGRDGR